MLVKCSTCNNEFNKPTCWAKRQINNYCTKLCRKNSLASKIEKTCKICNGPFHVYKSEDSRFSTCGESCFLQAKRKEHNPNCRGGKCSRRRETSSKEYKNWRKAVFVRDNKTCVLCREQKEIMHADHIKPWAFFPELRYEISNGRTLCPPCHYSVFKEVLKWRGTLWT